MMKEKTYNFFVKVILGFFLSYFIVVAGVVIFQRSLLYFPRQPYSEIFTQRILPNALHIQVTTSDNIRLSSLAIPPQNSTTPVLIAFHGNAALALDMSAHFKGLINQGYGIIFAEYRGYGGNLGTPTEEGFYKDAEAYLSYAQSQYPSSPIILYGQSLGSGVAVDLASKHNSDIRALILEVPFFSILNVVERTYPFIPFKNLLLYDQYLSNEKIQNITVPKLFLLAGKDEVVGFEDGKKLYNVAKEPKKIVVYEDATHNILGTHNIEQDIIVFLEEYQLGMQK